MVDIKEAILKVLREEYSTNEAMDINDGGCWVFAKKIQKLVPDSEVIWGCDEYPELDALGCCHAYIVHNSKCYDSETPDGVDRPHDLPYYRRKGLPLWMLEESQKNQ